MSLFDFAFNKPACRQNITLLNALEIGMVKKFLTGKDGVKQINVRMLAHSDAYMMAINEAIQEQLGLSFVEKRKLTMADGSV
ncbi:MAG: hypothetical protein H7Y86_04200 [Rhizobacter sp.]|nr:hypothetical protein [Ferruginibacter sp.]